MSDRPSLKPADGLKRTAGLPKPPPRPTPAGAGSAEQAPARTSEAAPPKPAPKAHKPKTSETAETVRAISLSLPLTIRTQLREHARATGQSQGDVVLDAVEATVDSLDRLIEGERPTPVSTGMFDRTPARQPSSEPYVALSLRMKSTNVATLDHLCQRHDAASRSQLCTVALRSYLNRAHAQAS